MGSYVATLKVAPTLRAAHFQATKTGGSLTGEMEALTQSHLQYLRDLKTEGKIIAAGPTVAFTWALMLLQADSIEEAKALTENDPAVKRGLFIDLKVEPWYHMV